MHARTQYTPLTTEEQQFAAKNHHIVEDFLRCRRLQKNEWYDVVIFRFLLSVKKWFQRPELHQWEFAAIAFNDMRSAVWSERDKQSRRIQTVSLDGIVPGTDDLMLIDTITEDNLKFVIYTEGEDMNISYDVPLPERRRKNKSDEVIAIEAFLTTLKMKNMRIEYDTEEEAKKKIISVRSYRNKNKLQEKIDVFRDGKDIYVVKIKKEDQ